MWRKDTAYSLEWGMTGRKRGYERIAATVGVVLLIGLFSPVLSTAIQVPIPVTTPWVSPNLVGTCTYVGNITLTMHSDTHESMYFKCSGAPIITFSASGETVTYSNGTTAKVNTPTNAIATQEELVKGTLSDPSSNLNYDIGWTSGTCATPAGGFCTDSKVAENRTMVPDTLYWSAQDNAYGNTFCGETLNYQNVPEIYFGSPYTNNWGVAYVTYPFCGSASVTEQFYSYLSGTNLNSGAAFETYYTLTSGYPTTAWLTVILSGFTYYTFSASIPSGNPNIPINGWENVVVCGQGGCKTTFNGGGGYILFPIEYAGVKPHH